MISEDECKARVNRAHDNAIEMTARNIVGGIHEVAQAYRVRGSVHEADLLDGVAQAIEDRFKRPVAKLKVVPPSHLQ
jgi:hypothetical protein